MAMWRKVRTAVASRDLAVSYGVIVTVTCLTLTVAPGTLSDRVVADTSTNLANLRQHPIYVLLASAFIEPSPSELWLVVLLVWACGAAQRQLGRCSTVIALTLAHVGATLFVATVLSAGIAHGAVGRSVAHVSDVGVSYALVGVAGLLVARMERRWSRVYFLTMSTYFTSRVLLVGGFSDLGHLTSWLIGLALAILVHQADVRGAGRTSSVT